MKRSKIVMSVTALAAMALLAFTGCPQEASDDPAPAPATLSEIKVAGVDADKIPTAITKAQWDADEYLDDYSGPVYTATVILPEPGSLTNAAIAVTASAGATVKYADATGTAKPDAAFDENATRTLTNNGILYIQVTSSDRKQVAYYRVQVKILNSVSSLNMVTVAGVSAESLGTPGASWNDTALVAGAIGISNAQKNNAAVAVTKTASLSTAKIAKASGATTPAFGAASDTASITFNDGDFLYIEVTAENGVSKSVYKLEVQIGRTATLATVTIGGRNAQGLGTPADSTGTPEPGFFLANIEQDEYGFAVTVTPSDAEATVKYARTSGSATPSTYNATNIGDPGVFTLTEIFNDLDSLWIEVTAANETTKKYYRILVNLQKSGVIKWGQPEIQASANQYIDALWNAGGLTEFHINKKGGEIADYTGTDTHGVAKVYWDEDGVYVYVDVTDATLSAAPTGTADSHLNDSVEFFLNEDPDPANNGTYAGRGSQFRVGSHGEKSGDAAAQVTASGWHKTDNTGYVVIFKAPWRYKVAYPVEGDKKIGIEIQLNACSANGTREGVVVWNNVAHGNYQNATDFGVATLDLNGHTLVETAKDPVISVHPRGKIYTSTGGAVDALTVSAASQDSGTLSYQWYSNTTNSYEGGSAIGSAESASYTPNIGTEGTTYYWVAVTNTIEDNEDGGNKTATLRSGRAGIIVSSVPLVEKITAGGSNVPAYQFTPPAGSTWSDYKKLTFTVLVADQGSYDNTACRAYIVGSYQASNFGSTGVWSKNNGWNDARLVNINNGAVLSAILGSPGLNVWKTMESTIIIEDIPTEQKDNQYAPDTYYPAAGATGPFYFGLGLTVNPNGGPTQPTITYYIKDVALVKENGDELPADDLMGSTSAGASVGQLYCSFSTSGVTQRVLEAEPSEE